MDTPTLSCLAPLSNRANVANHSGPCRRIRLARRLSACLVFSLLSVMGWSAAAQTVNFEGVVNPIDSSFGFLQPEGVAVDSSGDIFVADYGNNAIEEIKLSAGIYQTPVALATPTAGYNKPVGVAVDTTGDVFVADTKNGAVEEIPAGCLVTTTPSCVVPLATGLTNPEGIVVDKNGNVFVSTAVNPGAVYELTKSNSYASTDLTAGLILNSPVALAIDNQGNLYVGNYGTNDVGLIPYSGGTFGSYSSLLANFNGHPEGLAFDSSGNLYVINTHGATASPVQAPLYEVVAQSGVISASSTRLPMATSLVVPVGVAVTPNGNLIVGDVSYNTNGAVLEIDKSVVNFGSSAVGTRSSSSPIAFPFNFSATPASVSVSVLTEGAASSDFTDASDNCTGTTNTSCTINVNFTPSAAGARYGAVEVLISGSVVATAYVQGTGNGPQLSLSPASASSLGLSGLSSPQAIVADEKGDIFVADGASVNEYAHGSTAPVAVGSGWTAPSSMALDAAGNLFVIDSGKMWEVLSSGYTTKNQVASGLISPSGIAVDTSGNVYYSDKTSKTISEIYAASGYTVTTVLSGTFDVPQGLATDGNGDLFVADSGANEIFEYVAVDGAVSSSTVPAQVASGFTFSGPEAIAVIGNGTILVAQTGGIEEVFATGGYTTWTSFAAVNSPNGLAVDGSGNAYYLSSSNNLVAQLNAPTLTFKQTQAGLTSSDSPQYVTLANIGVGTSPGSDITFTVPGSGTNPAISANFLVDSTSTCPQLTNTSIAGTLTVSNSTCTYGIDFSPGATTAGPVTGQMVVTDDIGSQTISLSGSAVYITLSPASLTGAMVGENYNAPLTASGGTTGSTYTFSAGTGLPPGITLSSAGVLSGTPTAEGSFTFAVTATDGNGFYGTENYTLTVNSPTIVITPAAGALPAATAGAAYTTVTFGATGGTSPYTWSENGTLPAGLTFDATAGTLSGTPTQAGSFSFSVTATDHSTGTGAPFSQTNAYTLTVNSPTVMITPGAGTLPAATAGVAYTTVTFGATGGTSPYTWSENGTLPAGLTFNATAGTLSGTPTQAGTFSFSVTATDHSTGTGAPFSQTNAYTLAVNSPTITLSPAAGTLPAGTAYAAYNQTFTAGGGTGPYTFSEMGALPAGITLSSAGVLSGTPTAGGTFNFTVIATDSSTGTGSPFSQSGNYTLVINGPTITISPATLPAGNVGVPYSSAFSASGGGTSYTYTETGVLPAGLALSSAGALSGTPTAGGTFNFTVTARDNNGFSSSPQTYTLAIGSAVITLLPANLPAGQVNTAYSQTFTAGGGTSPYTFSETGPLPAGMTFSSAGVLSGTPTAGGTFNFTITATDSSTGTGPYSASVAYSLTLAPGSATLNFAAIPPQTYGNSPFTVAASSSSTGAVTYSIISGPATIGGTTGLVTLTGAGMLTIGASQAATSSYAAATAQTTISVAQQASHVAVSASSSSITPGQSVTITANVTPAVFGAPTGTVTFFSGTLQLGSPVPLTGGMAQLALTTLPSGSDQISATYSGDANFLMSSGSLSGGITVAALGFTLTASPATQTGARGTTFAFLLTATPTYGMYPGTVTFSASGLPPGATATFSPSSLAVNAGPQNVGLAIATTTSTAAVHALPIGRGLAPVALAFLLLPLAGTRRMRREGRRFGRFLCLLLLAMAGVAATTALSGCGANTYQQSTTSQNYTVTITATSGTVQQSSTVTLTLH